MDLKSNVAWRNSHCGRKSGSKDGSTQIRLPHRKDMLQAKTLKIQSEDETQCSELKCKIMMWSNWKQTYLTLTPGMQGSNANQHFHLIGPDSKASFSIFSHPSSWSISSIVDLRWSGHFISQLTANLQAMLTMCISCACLGFVNPFHLVTLPRHNTTAIVLMQPSEARSSADGHKVWGIHDIFLCRLRLQRRRVSSRLILLNLFRPNFIHQHRPHPT